MDFNKKAKIAKYFIITIFILCISLIIIFSKRMPGIKIRTCVGQMGTIHGAIELYYKEKNNLNISTVSDLVESGYLKAEPQCHSSKEYFGLVLYQPQLHKYKIIFSNSNTRQGRFDFDVECETHGKLSAIK